MRDGRQAEFTISFTEETDEGEEIVHELPARFEVCEGCRGRGSHVNRAVDGDGLTAEDFAEDPDFEEAYFRGDYDVTCEDCDGLRVQKVLDEEACAHSEWLTAVASRYHAALESDAEYRRCCAAERRVGA